MLPVSAAGAVIARQASTRHCDPPVSPLCRISPPSSPRFASKKDRYGWLFYDILHRDPICLPCSRSGPRPGQAALVLRDSREGHSAKTGPPHRIRDTLDSLPGDKMLYAAAEELEKNLTKLFRSAARKSGHAVLAQKFNSLYLARGRRHRRTDPRAGLQSRKFRRPRPAIREAAWTPEQLADRIRAAGRGDEHAVTRDAFAEAARRGFRRPIVHGIRSATMDRRSIPGQRSGFGFSADRSRRPAFRQTRTMNRESTVPSPVRRGDLLLLDIWAKTLAPDSVYYDITWVGFLGDKVPGKNAKIFSVVRDARNAAVDFCKEKALSAGRAIEGAAGGPRAAREVIRAKRASPNISCTAPATISDRKCTATARTWIASKLAISAALFRTPASRSSRASTCRISVCAVKSTSTSGTPRRK